MNPTKFLQDQALRNLLEIEPYILLAILILVTYVFYRTLLRSVSEERHRNIRNHFGNIIRHFLVLSLLFFGYLFLNQITTEAFSLSRISPYVGIVTLIWGMIVFVKTCRLIVLQYLFMGSMQTGVPLLLVNIFSLLLSIILIFWTASHVFAIQLAPLLATSAAFSIILGLALQDTLGNLFAGIAMQIDKTFEIGNWIELSNGSTHISGKVSEITWRSTILVGWFQEVITLPNRMMAQAQISNFSPGDNPVIRSVIFKIKPGHDPKKIKSILEDSLHGLADIRGIPSAFSYVFEANNYYISYKLVYWIDDFGNQYLIGDKVYCRGFEALKSNGIELAMPYMEIETRSVSIEKQVQT